MFYYESSAEIGSGIEYGSQKRKPFKKDSQEPKLAPELNTVAQAEAVHKR